MDGTLHFERRWPKKTLKLFITTEVHINKNSKSYIYKGALFIVRYVEVTNDNK